MNLKELRKASDEAERDCLQSFMNLKVAMANYTYGLNQFAAARKAYLDERLKTGD